MIRGIVLFSRQGRKQKNNDSDKYDGTPYHRFHRGLCRFFPVGRDGFLTKGLSLVCLLRLGPKLMVPFHHLVFREIEKSGIIFQKTLDEDLTGKP